MRRRVDRPTRITDLADLAPTYNGVTLMEVRKERDKENKESVLCSANRDALGGLVRVPIAAYESFFKRHIYPTVGELKNYVNDQKEGKS